jgi:hypothetical protein
MTSRKKKVKSVSDYDAAWKEVIEEHLEFFFEFFFPEIHEEIDFSKKPEILSQELRKIVPDNKVGKRYADVLIKVHLKNGSQRCICVFIHMEVQGTREPDFPLRMFIYYYRIFDKYREKGAEIISLAVLTDEDENYRPDQYYFNRWGFELRMKLPVIKIIDYKNKKELQKKLEITSNPMAMVVKAQLKSLEAKKRNENEKYSIKWELIKQFYKNGYDKEAIRSLFHFIDLVIRLPDYLEKKLSEEIIRIEEEYKMPYVTSWERIAKKEGKKEGIQEGIQKGIQKGKFETAQEMLSDGLPIERIRKYTGLTEKEIKALMN